MPRAFPHARAASVRRPKSEGARKERALLLYNGAWYAWLRGGADEVEKMSTMLMKTRVGLFGKGHAETLRSMAMVGLARNLGGQWKKAEELEVQVMETFKRVLGAEHPDTRTSMGNLAATYRKQERRKEAEKLDMQVMETSARVLGPEHPGTLTSMSDLALTLKAQGHSSAISMMNKCVQLRTQVLGHKHPDTTSSLKIQNEWRMESLGISG